MPFVKLDVRLLESTLWEDFDGTRVFTAALLMAEPREFLGAIAELEVDANTETGFVLEPGWYGFVPASGPGIVRRAMLDQPRGLAALRRLVAEDGQSRTVQHAGKRLMRVDGGFIVLNFMAYRERDMSGAERARRYRLRKAGKSAPPEAGIRQTPRRAAKSPTGLSTESSTVTRDALPSLDLSVDKSSSSHRDAHAYDTDRHATVTVRRDITEAEAEVEPLTLSLPPGEEGQGRETARTMILSVFFCE